MFNVAVVSVEMYSDTDSFHPSLWEEERQQRQQIHFEFADLPDDEEVILFLHYTCHHASMAQQTQHCAYDVTFQLL